MVKRHLTMPFSFICFTENPKDIDTNIKILLLPKDDRISGWWWKTYIFKAGHFPVTDVNLFFDLDMVIIGNIDKLVTYEQYKFVGLQDASRVFNKPDKLQSAVMRWRGDIYSNIWTKIEKDPELVKKYSGGDQDYIWNLHKDRILFYPKLWILSYKWEVRNKSEIVRLNNKTVFKDVRDVELDKETVVLAFHGTPEMEDVQDKIIVENWQ
jgi:hypothetical protein